MKKLISLPDNTSTAFEEYHAATECLRNLNAPEWGIYQDPADGLRLEFNMLETGKDSSIRQDICGPFNDYLYKQPKSLDKIKFSQTTAATLCTIFRYVPSHISDQLFKDRRLDEMISTLYDLLVDYSLPNWDGYEAKPISRSVHDDAVRFIKMLPSDLPLPDALPEPLGSIAFEWYKAKDKVFVASVSGKGIVEYAGLYGIGNRDYGTARIENTFPKIVSHHIRRLFED